MTDIKKLELTEDPLTNIERMTPLLNEESRKAMSYLMYGCYLGESMARESQQNEPLAVAIQGRW